MKGNQKMAGIQSNFWIGCVEERDDSKAKDKLKLGRVRVRVLGFHSEKKDEDNASGEGIPTDKLLWAYPVSPVTSAAISGIGQSPTGVVEGTWVVGFSMDGTAMQDLYILGTLAGVPSKKPSSNNGFADPNGKYPEYTGESDLSRFARAENLGQTSLVNKQVSKEISVRSARGGRWSEPSPPYKAKYPYNHVRQSESGHIEEWDDTDGAERINREHASGTFEEWHPDGSEVRKIQGDGYEIHLEDRNMLVKGKLNITVEGNCNIRSKGNINLESDKNIDMKARGSIKMFALKGINIKTPRKVSIKGIFGFSAKAVVGRASVASPVNLGKSTAKAVG